MKIAVIGGGTAGYMAAAQISKFFPTYDLYHIYDSRIPTIGVGEGTLPAFRTWIHAITGLEFAQLQQKCAITEKLGIRFENWGTRDQEFDNYFGGGRVAYHISAAKLVPLLQDYVKATHLDQRVVDLQSSGREVKITFENESELEVDFAFDARGFPKSSDESLIKLAEIPTNAALIRQGAVAEFQGATRSVARPHGWIFIIPLTTHTSYGYIYNDNISSKGQVQADFEQFLQAEQVTPFGKERALRFPNFTSRTFFDGALFKIGNVASFLEPLEGTAIGVILEQLRLASYWLADGLFGVSGELKWNPLILNILNEQMLNDIQTTALFVGWHYASGSAFDSPFWRFAQVNFEGTLKRLENQSLLEQFSKYLQTAAEFPFEHLQLVQDRQAYQDLILPKLHLKSNYGAFNEVAFAQIGHGIGYFSLN